MMIIQLHMEFTQLIKALRDENQNSTEIAIPSLYSFEVWLYKNKSMNFCVIHFVYEVAQIINIVTCKVL